MDGNLYLNSAVPGSHEPNAKVDDHKGIKVEFDPEQGKVHVHIDEPKLFAEASPAVITTDFLGKTHHADMKHEQPDSTPYRFESDFSG
ncbi:hypothetical protein [Alkalibacterium sp. 20]|uniref:hypothetical protein n=1 Tax=Alkalibacterium sp. 20 TaxID=1798803 RepID=UPI0009001DCC|nr:hypothetical protein [Alkalibacterium sp. 20]OJF91539.1 hypothetical protein AX762_03215 [Alkalibacterium sp. 20]